ncbi:alpha/beta hydrolase [Nocardioides piscis]|uniref:Alpha/beta hydrolase n=1 Tax=Nocardioides piscis TaxID=2714938 RepID=A0A6G7YEE1_9ACTN|nr:alpha/beta hydrolase [Nocardioides piscis]QIK75274.1 alpha/beta hydrolase [Nocardioides piscis]
MPLDPQLKDMLDFIAVTGHPPIDQGSPEEGRRAMRAMSVDLVKPEDVVPVGSVTPMAVPGGAGERDARLYKPEGEGPWDTLVFLHGGGFVVGDLDTHDQTCRRLCRDAEIAVLSVDYRLAPEDPFPAGLEDALAATEWAAAHLADLGGGERLAIGGDSAGGNLSAVVAQHLGDVLAAQLLIYPATDGLGDYPSKVDNAEGYFLTAAMMEWFSGHYVPADADPETDLARLAPLHGDVSDVAPALVATAEFDPLRDEGEAYAEALRAAGVHVDQVRYDGMIHGFCDMVSFSSAAADAVSDLNVRFRSLMAER